MDLKGLKRELVLVQRLNGLFENEQSWNEFKLETTDFFSTPLSPLPPITLRLSYKEDFPRLAITKPAGKIGDLFENWNVETLQTKLKDFTPEEKTQVKSIYSNRLRNFFYKNFSDIESKISAQVEELRAKFWNKFTTFATDELRKSHTSDYFRLLVYIHNIIKRDFHRGTANLSTPVADEICASLGSSTLKDMYNALFEQYQLAKSSLVDQKKVNEIKIYFQRELCNIRGNFGLIRLPLKEPVTNPLKGKLAYSTKFIMRCHAFASYLLERTAILNSTPVTLEISNDTFVKYLRFLDCLVNSPFNLKRDQTGRAKLREFLLAKIMSLEQQYDCRLNGYRITQAKIEKIQQIVNELNLTSHNFTTLYLVRASIKSLIKHIKFPDHYENLLETCAQLFDVDKLSPSLRRVDELIEECKATRNIAGPTWKTKWESILKALSCYFHLYKILVTIHLQCELFQDIVFFSKTSIQADLVQYQGKMNQVYQLIVAAAREIQDLWNEHPAFQAPRGRVD